jgi:HEAT repeat protein
MKSNLDGAARTPGSAGNKTPRGAGKLVWMLLTLVLAAGTAIFLFQERGSSTESFEVESSEHIEAQSEASSTAESQSATLRMSPDAAAVNSQIAELIRQLMDESLPMKNRRHAARALARHGSDDSMAALELALQNGPSALKSAIAQALGESPHPDAPRRLLELIDSSDEAAARGAVRGLALRADSEAVEALGNLLFNAQKALSVRTEAALALGELDHPSALNLLGKAVWDIKDPTVLEHVLEGIGKRPFNETEEFFRSYLESPHTSADAKVAAIEALANSPGDVTSLLLKQLNNSDAEIRQAAAWALSAMENPVAAGPQMLAFIQQETDPAVRARLYQALDGQSDADARAVLALARSETDPIARLAAFEFLAGALRTSPGSEIASFFNQTAIPELKQRALESAQVQDRLSAVLILRRAQTAAAAEALREIAAGSPDQKVADAARAASQTPALR